MLGRILQVVGNPAVVDVIGDTRKDAYLAATVITEAGDADLDVIDHQRSSTVTLWNDVNCKGGFHTRNDEDDGRGRLTRQVPCGWEMQIWESGGL